MRAPIRRDSQEPGHVPVLFGVNSPGGAIGKIGKGTVCKNLRGE